MGHPRIDPLFEALLEHAIAISPVPDLVRARALARARATVSATSLSTKLPVSVGRTRRFPIAVAASLASLLGVAGTAGALLARARQRASTSPSSERAVPPARVVAPHDLRPMTAPQPAPVARARHVRHQAAAPESYEAELELLQRARASYAGRDFQDALVLLAEHARRFPNGRLAEEREALRVHSFAVCGRLDEARNAAGAFASRFPRSVLLPRLAEAVAAAR
jgi:hypothetical protein